MIPQQQARALKRISRDLQEIKNNPQIGISIDQPFFNDPFLLLVNIEITQGPYKGVKLHMNMNVQNYPIQAPKMQIFEGQLFTQQFHHHVFGNDFCIDILRDAVMDTNVQGTGWTPNYTFLTLLLQIQNFLSDPDMNENQINQQIKRLPQLFDQQQKFSIQHNLGNNQMLLIHTWNNPFPPFPVIQSKDELYQQQQQQQKGNQGLSDEQQQIIQIQQQQQQNQNQNNDQQQQQEQIQFQEEEQKVQKMEIEVDLQENQNHNYIKERLTCFVTKSNPFEDPNMIVGYPIFLYEDKTKLNISPITEILSYEGYQELMQDQQNKVESGVKFNKRKYQNQFVKSGNGQPFNLWVPIFMNLSHYEKNEQLIKDQLALIYYGKQNKFYPDLIIKVFPQILNQFAVNLLKGTIHQSIAAIEAYIHFLRMFKTLITAFNNQISNKLEEKLYYFLLDDFNRNKEKIPDMGQFVILLNICQERFWNNVETMNCVIRETTSRQIFWREKNRKQQFNDYKDELKDFFETQSVGCFMLIWNIEIQKAFSSDEFLMQLECSNSVVDEQIAETFINRIKYLQQTIKSYNDWFQYLGYEKMKDIEILALMNKSYALSNAQGYTKNYQQPVFDLKQEQNEFKILCQDDIQILRFKNNTTK